MVNNIHILDLIFLLLSLLPFQHHLFLPLKNYRQIFLFFSNFVILLSFSQSSGAQNSVKLRLVLHYFWFHKLGQWRVIFIFASGYLMLLIWRYTVYMVLGSRLKEHMCTNHHPLKSARTFLSGLIAQQRERRAAA